MQVERIKTTRQRARTTVGSLSGEAFFYCSAGSGTRNSKRKGNVSHLAGTILLDITTWTGQDPKVTRQFHSPRVTPTPLNLWRPISEANSISSSDGIFDCLYREIRGLSKDSLTLWNNKSQTKSSPSKPQQQPELSFRLRSHHMHLMWLPFQAEAYELSRFCIFCQFLLRYVQSLLVRLGSSCSLPNHCLS